MEGFSGIFVQMVVLFSVIVAGYTAKKTGHMDAAVDKKLSGLVLTYSLPALIISSVINAEQLPSPNQMLLCMGLAVVGYAFLFVMAFLVTKLMGTPFGKRGAFRFMLVFGNTAFIGYPVVSAVFGPDAIVYASVYNLPFNLLVFTLGIWFLVSDVECGAKVRIGWKTFLTPGIISCVVAIVLSFAGVHGVPVVGDALAALGSLTTPASLLIVGSMLANIPVRDLVGGPRLFIMSAFRLVIIPLTMWFALSPFVSDKLLLAVLVVTLGMPVAANGSMLSLQYGGDSRTMAQGTFITTVISLVTIPLLAQIIG